VLSGAATFPIARTLSPPVPYRDGSLNPNWNVETIGRVFSAVLAGAATPALVQRLPRRCSDSRAGAATPAPVGFAAVRWVKGIRQELPPWRNGMGLTSIVVVPALWLFQMTRWLMLSMNRELTASYGNLREFELFLPAFFVYPALPLACALKSSPRLLMIAAWLAVLFSGPFSYR
jgi:hypothetical protein